MTASTTPPATDPDKFIARLRKSLTDGDFVGLTLGRPDSCDPSLQKLLARRLVLRGEEHLSLLWRHQTRDITRNLPIADALALIRNLLAAPFHHAHLVTCSHDIQLALSRKGRWSLRVGKLPSPPIQPASRASTVGSPVAPAVAHDRERRYALSLDTPFLAELGVTDKQHRLVPAMARKWRQINKFAEILGHAIAQSRLADSDPTRPVRVLDFGAGKGYLTFAVHHQLQGNGRLAEVVGVELREELTTLCNDAVARLGLQGLRFAAGDIAEFARAVRNFTDVPDYREPAPGLALDRADPSFGGTGLAESSVDIMIALHACDIATDIAIHHGIRARAEIILCSPCCHKELRPQMRAPAVLVPMLRHGIHMTEQAEMLTDSLRALLLQAHGYDTQVFEFISPEHTGKNRMVLAVRRATRLSGAQRDTLLAQVAALKAFYGVTRQHLETLLFADADTGSDVDSDAAQVESIGVSSACCAGSR